MSAHTPGPWTVLEGSGGWIQTQGSPYGKGTMHIADVRGWGHLTGTGSCHFGAEKAAAIQDANARLISAAPDLLSAAYHAIYELRCAGIGFNLDTLEVQSHPCTDFLLAAIAKAESGCLIHVRILPADVPCPACAKGDPADDPRCVRYGHVTDPGALRDCKRCGGPVAFLVTKGSPL